MEACDLYRIRNYFSIPCNFIFSDASFVCTSIVVPLLSKLNLHCVLNDVMDNKLMVLFKIFFSFLCKIFYYIYYYLIFYQIYLNRYSNHPFCLFFLFISHFVSSLPTMTFHEIYIREKNIDELFPNSICYQSSFIIIFEVV